MRNKNGEIQNGNCRHKPISKQERGVGRLGERIRMRKNKCYGFAPLGNNIQITHEYAYSK